MLKNTESATGMKCWRKWHEKPKEQKVMQECTENIATFGKNTKEYLNFTNFSFKQ